MKSMILPVLLSVLIASCNPGVEKKIAAEEPAEKPAIGNDETAGRLIYENEKHFADVKQLTFGGENAEAYWSYDDKNLVFQRTHIESGVECDQIYFGNVEDFTCFDEKLKNDFKQSDCVTEIPDFKFKLVSTGKGKTTCAYFIAGNSEVIYASTHLKHNSCPPPIDRNLYKEYVWQLHPEFELFRADTTGKVLQQYTNNDYYDAEATLSPTGDKIVFTSTRSGDLELWTMNVDGSELYQVTDELGYDGGAFFSPDGNKLVFRASRPSTPEAIKKYTDLLAKDMVSPSDMEIYVCNVDGSDMQQITRLGGANWAPYFHPSGEKIVFCTNHHTGGFPFNIFIINTDGSGLQQITYDKTFDSFPMFSYDGKYLAFSSNRNNGGTRHTNLFIARWMD